MLHQPWDLDCRAPNASGVTDQGAMKGQTQAKVRPRETGSTGAKPRQGSAMVPQLWHLCVRECQHGGLLLARMQPPFYTCHVDHQVHQLCLNFQNYKNCHQKHLIHNVTTIIVLKLPSHHQCVNSVCSVFEVKAKA